MQTVHYSVYHGKTAGLLFKTWLDFNVISAFFTVLLLAIVLINK